MAPPSITPHALLTPRQREILEFIRNALTESGAPPTRDEIARAFGFRSLNAAEQHLQALPPQQRQAPQARAEQHQLAHMRQQHHQGSPVDPTAKRGGEGVEQIEQRLQPEHGQGTIGERQQVHREPPNG
jgi:SOS-response transcriptional repressor LexA